MTSVGAYERGRRTGRLRRALRQLLRDAPDRIFPLGFQTALARRVGLSESNVSVEVVAERERERRRILTAGGAASVCVACGYKLWPCASCGALRCACRNLGAAVGAEVEAAYKQGIPVHWINGQPLYFGARAGRVTVAST